MTGIVGTGGRAAPPSRRAVPGLVAVAIGVVYLLLTPWTTLWERDEPRYARAAVEMARSGDLIVPTVNEEVRARKPPFIYWLMALGVWARGQREIAVRCWSAVAVACAALLTCRLGRQLVGDRAATTAMLLMVVNPMMAVQGMAATTDAVLLAAITAAVVFGAEGLLGGLSATRVLGVAVSVAVAQMTKGPVGLVLPWLVLAPLAIERRREGGGRRFGVLTLAMLAGVVPYLAWLFAADAASGGLFTHESLGREVVTRIVQPLEGHGGPRWLGVPFYLAVVAIGFAPSSVWLTLGVPRLTRQAGRQARALLFGWAVVPILVFSLAATRLPHYVLPAWPALALIAAVGAEGIATDATDRERRWVAWASLVSAGVFAAIVLAVATFVPLMPARLAAVAVAGVLAAGGAAAWRVGRGGRPADAPAVGLVTAGCALALCAAWLAPAVEPLKISPRLAALIRQVGGPSVPVSTFDYAEPGLDFYLDRSPIGRLGTPADVGDWAGMPNPGLLVLTDEARRQPAVARALERTREVGQVRGYDYVKGRFLDVVVVSRAGEAR